MAKTRIPKRLRTAIKERAKGYCEYCLIHESFSPAPFSIDHIFPESLGGSSTSENLALACGGCNGHKFIRSTHIDPLSKEVVRLYNPRNDNWHNHFEWNGDETVMIGKTTIGRATIHLLDINRESNINLRVVLCAFGYHPPSDFQ